MKKTGKKTTHTFKFFLLTGTAFFLIAALVISSFFIYKKIHTIERAVSVIDKRQRSTQEEQQEGDTGEEIFKTAVESIDELLEQRHAEETEKLFAALTAEEDPASLAGDTGMRFRFDGDLRGTLLRNERRYFRLRGDKVKGEVEIESLTEESLRVENNTADAREFVIEQRDQLDGIVENENEMREKIIEITERGNTADLITSKDMATTRIVKEDFVLRRGITNSGGAVVVRIEADAEHDQYRVDGERIEDEDKLNKTVYNAVDNYDPQEEILQTLERLEERLKILLDDEGFQAYLHERELKIADTPEDNSKNNAVQKYPLIEENAGNAGYIVLDAEEGEIYIEDEQQKVQRTLDSVMVTHGLGGSSSQDTGDPAFLLLGEHDGLSDTIMLVKPDSRTVSMIGIPRDLYYRGRKLNELHLQEGPEGTMSAVQEITGVEINHYVTIDTGGFSDLVDSLGSITVELENELLDPNMHYSSKGDMRMLYFSAGPHEIEGDAALALVRSRSTTSDFSRARRQQLVLEGIRSRADQLSLSDAGKLYDLIQTVIKYTDTDLGIRDLLRYYRRYRDVVETRHLVLSSDNILYSTYLGLHSRDMELRQAKELEEEQLGAWILLPRGNDWGAVSWYVGTWLSGIEPDSEAVEERIDG